jgi:hypothetical protein
LINEAIVEPRAWETALAHFIHRIEAQAVS